jgi:hypothetical protein
LRTAWAVVGDDPATPTDESADNRPPGQRFMVLTRTKNQPGPDGVLGPVARRHRIRRGQPRRITVRFRASTPLGAKTATLNIASNALAAPTTIPLTGNATL